jgi:hypothetical protein
MRYALFTLTLYALALTSTIAQTLPSVPQQILASNQLEVDLLKQQLEIHKQYTSDILSTVYFTLGVSLTLVVATIGLGWYQNHKVYERDKAELERVMAEFIRTTMGASQKELEFHLKSRFESFDESMAKAIGSLGTRVQSVRVVLSAEIFRAKYSEETPRTDFAVLMDLVSRCADEIEVSALERATSVIISHIEGKEISNGVTRTALMGLVERLPSQLAPQAERIREILKKSSEKMG